MLVKLRTTEYSIKLELTVSTMSASSSYQVEMPSIRFENPAERTESDENGYTAIGATSPNRNRQRNRRLPMPPAFEPQRPKKPITFCGKSCKELISYCVDSRLILSLPLLVLAMTGVGGVIYILVTSKVIEPPTTTTPPTRPPDEGVPEGSQGTLKFALSPVQKPGTLSLLQERMGQNVTILQISNHTNGTWSIDGREIVIGISMTDEVYFHIVLNIEISNSQCRHAGKYFVLMPASNGIIEESRLYNVKASCPCESAFELNSDRTLKCVLKVKGNTTVSFNKVIGDNTKPILFKSGIRIPDNVPEIDGFSAVWDQSGTLITLINFSPVQCHDEGNYSLTVTSRLGTQEHYIYVKVIDHPMEPSINILKPLIERKSNEIKCQANTGCKNASLVIEATQQKGKDYTPWNKTLTSTPYQEGYLWKVNTTQILDEYTVDYDILQNRKFRCKYTIDGRSFFSQSICMQIIEAGFCEKKKPTQYYSHPYNCNKFITCTTDIVELSCQPGQYYNQKLNQCDSPDKANCTLGLYYGCG